MENIGRNDPCPCNSGRKFKRCHGKVETKLFSRERSKIADQTKSFLRSEVDLQGTIFSGDDLRWARHELTHLLSQIAPNWIESPVGELSKRWNDPVAYNACFFIEIARIFKNLYRQSTGRSKNVLLNKMAALFDSTGKQFDALLNEIQVGDFLLTFKSTIELEPSVEKKSGNEGRPDYAITLNNRLIYVDVTRLQYRVLDEWEETADRSVKLLGDLCGNALNGKVVRVVLPLECRKEPINEADAKSIVSKMHSVDCSTMEVKRRMDAGMTVEWHTVTIIEREHPTKAWIAFDYKPADYPFSFLPGSEMRFVFHGTDLLLRYDSPRTDPSAFEAITEVTTGISAIFLTQLPQVQADELLYKAICNRAKKKLDQFTHSEPFLLVICLKHSDLIGRAFLHLIAKRLWSNQMYERISGIALFEPHTDFSPGKNAPSAVFSLNPNARNPIGDDLRSVLLPV